MPSQRRLLSYQQQTTDGTNDTDPKGKPSRIPVCSSVSSVPSVVCFFFSSRPDSITGTRWPIARRNCRDAKANYAAKKLHPFPYALVPHPHGLVVAHELAVA